MKWSNSITMRDPNFDYHKIVETLQGQCQYDLDQAIQLHSPNMTEMDLTPEDRTDIDLEVFLCDECGWWCEISELCTEETPYAGFCDSGACESCCTEEHVE